jgi:hypothetical protein
MCRVRKPVLKHSSYPAFFLTRLDHRSNGSSAFLLWIPPLNFHRNPVFWLVGSSYRKLFMKSEFRQKIPANFITTFPNSDSDLWQVPETRRWLLTSNFITCFLLSDILPFFLLHLNMLSNSSHIQYQACWRWPPRAWNSLDAYTYTCTVCLST